MRTAEQNRHLVGLDWMVWRWWMEQALTISNVGMVISDTFVFDLDLQCWIMFVQVRQHHQPVLYILHFGVWQQMSLSKISNIIKKASVFGVYCLEFFVEWNCDEVYLEKSKVFLFLITSMLIWGPWWLVDGYGESLTKSHTSSAEKDSEQVISFKTKRQFCPPLSKEWFKGNSTGNNHFLSKMCVFAAVPSKQFWDDVCFMMSFLCTLTPTRWLI